MKKNVYQTNRGSYSYRTEGYENVLLNNKKLYKFLTFLTTAILIFSVFVFTPTIVADPNDPWYDSDWSYRKQIIIDHTKNKGYPDPRFSFSQAPSSVGSFQIFHVFA